MNNKEMKSVKILHLEDNQYDFELISRMLSDAGFETSIRWASSRDEYLAELENPDFDLVLCDFMIPGYNAFGALEDLLEHSLLIPFICVSGSIGEETAVELLIAGATDYILKDRLARLPSAINRALELGEEKRLRIWTQNQLSQSEEQYRELYNNAVMGLYRTNQKGEVLLANQTLLNMLGYDSIEELKEINIEEKGFESFNERQLFLNLIDKTEELKGHNSKWMRKDGSYIYVRESARLRRDKDGSPLYYDGIVEDITEKKIAEDALKASQQLFHTLALVSPVGIFRTDTSGYTTYVNPRWSELSGIPFEDALGFGWMKGVHPEDQKPMSDQWAEACKNKIESLAHYRFIKPDGSIVWVMGNSVPEIVDGETIGYVGTITDITQIKLFEESLLIAKEKAERASALKDAFINNLSHEIRTPLNGIVGMAGIIQEIFEESASPEETGFFNSLVRSTERLINTVEMMLLMSQIQTGDHVCKPEHTGLATIVERVVNDLREHVQEKNLEVSVIRLLEDDSAFVDPTDAKNIIHYLFDNAVKYTKNGTVEISLFNIDEHSVGISIKDSGVGISKEYLPDLFEPFVQQEMGYSRPFEGMGLGLPIVKKLVDANNGEIKVESEPGKGSTFTLGFRKG
jgi:PAS domain S-box-containing protein